MTQSFWPTNEFITSWPEFEMKISSKGCQLLKRLDDFPNSILVTGCQRSGTTMLTRVITQSDGMAKYWFGPDDELDAALILSGYVDYQPQGRCCFQTTYINDRFHEYSEHGDEHKIIFLLRNPLSVVYSMLYNWNDYALNLLFNLCGINSLTGSQKWLHKYVGIAGVNKLYRACFAYNGKISQLYHLKKTLNSGRLMIVDYDDLVLNKNVILPKIYDFVHLDYAPDYSDKILAESLKKMDKLSKREKSTISRLCLPIYYDLRQFCATG